MILEQEEILFKDQQHPLFGNFNVTKYKKFPKCLKKVIRF